MCVHICVGVGESHTTGASLGGKDGWGTSSKRLFSASLLKSAMNKAELGGRCLRGLESLNQGKV